MKSGAVANASAFFGWERRGPRNLGGRTRALAIDAGNENVLLAGGVSGGMWRSTDGGASWLRTTKLAQHPGVTCIAQDLRPGKGNVWYYGSGEYRGNSAAEDGDDLYKGEGIFKSIDGGASWDLLPATATGEPEHLGSKFDFVFNIAANPVASADELLAAVSGAIMRSTDGGASWNATLGQPGTGGVYSDVIFASTGIAYAAMTGAARGVWRSVDGGATWKNISTAWPASVDRTVLALAPSNERVLYVLAETPGRGYSAEGFEGVKEWHSFWKYSYLSGDGSGAGGAWDDRSTNLPSFGGHYGNFLSQNSYALVVKVKPDDENVVFIGGTNLYRSSDGFSLPDRAAWTGGYGGNDFPAHALFTSYPGHHPDQHAIAFSRSNPLVMFSGNDGGVQKTLNNMAAAVEWTPLNNSYLTTQFYAVAVEHAIGGSNMIVGGMQDNGTWRMVEARDRDWEPFGPGDGGYCAIADGARSIYGSAQEGLIFRVEYDSTGALTGGTEVDPEGAEGYLFIAPFALDPDNTDVMYLAAGEYLWRNSNLTEIPLGQTFPDIINWQRLDISRTLGASISAIGVRRCGDQSGLLWDDIREAVPAH